MQLDDDLRSLKKLRLSWRGMMGLTAASAPIIVLCIRLNRFDLAEPLLASVVVLGIVLATKWDLRRNLWFWIAMTIIVSLHIVAIMLVPWTTKWVPAFVFVPFAFADVYAILWVLSRVNQFVGG